MCIIVDGNRLGMFLADGENADAGPIHAWLRRGKGVVVYSTGRTFAKGLGRRARDRLAQYVRAGMAVRVSEEGFREDARFLRTRIRSDDPHVLALARASGARILYTADRRLMDDFKDKRFIDEPRGKVYTGAANAKSLARTPCRRRSG